MSIPKEPRQLMINIMYLVLTALLALNVSAEVLKAFDRVDKGMKNANTVVDGSNVILRDAIATGVEQDPKYAILADKASEASALSNEFCTYLEGVKQRLFDESGGYKSKEDPSKGLKGAKNTEIPTNIFVDNGLGDEIKAKITQLKSDFISIIDTSIANHESVLADYESTLTLGKGVIDFTPDPKHPKYDWKTETFQKVPVAAVFPMLTAFQADAKRAEASMLEKLKSEIGKTDYKFDKLSATVLAETKYLVTGSDYNADIFLSASSSSTQPEVYLGTFTSEVEANEDGSYKTIEAKGEDEIPLSNAAPLEVDPITGRAKFNVKATGSSKRQGVMKVRSQKAEGKFDYFPFSFEYETFNPGGVVIAPTAMNVLYIGVDNPVDITAGNANPSTVSASGCGVSKASGPGKYVARPTGSPRSEAINVSGKTNEGDPVSGSMEFRIKRIPDPYMFLGPKKTGGIPKAVAAAQGGLIAKNDDFVFQVPYRIKGFDLIYAPRSGPALSAQSNNNKFTAEQKKILTRMKGGDRLFFSNVKVKMPDGSTRQISGNFTIL